jgi:hypothetical protein
LDTLRKVGFQLQETKCTFGWAKAPFLGFEIDGECNSIRMPHKKVKAITDWADPETPRNMKSCVGQTGVYRRFIPDIARISAPLLSLVTVYQRAFDACCTDPT